MLETLASIILFSLIAIALAVLGYIAGDDSGKTQGFVRGWKARGDYECGRSEGGEDAADRP